jgi:hypothetical protein
MTWRRKGDAVEIADWLRGLGLEKYAPAFDENAINWDVLSGLTTDVLKEIGVAAIGDGGWRRLPLSARVCCRLRRRLLALMVDAPPDAQTFALARDAV